MHADQSTAKLPLRLPGLLFALAVIVYLAVRIVGLERFPIYFFSDEAIQTVRAADFIRDGFRSESQEFFPTYFKNSYQYNLGPSVYIQILPTLLFGKHIWVTRGTSLLFTLLAALAVGLSAQKIWTRSAGWLAVLLFSLMPAWFLHSRTAFETALSVSFYAAFWYCYLMYRQKDRRYIYAAALFAALAFYSYSPAQIVVPLTILAFFVNDFHYHLAGKKVWLPTLLLALLLSLPYFRFLHNHPGEILTHLQLVRANWVTDMTFPQKVSTYLLEYLRGLNPLYWLTPNGVDLPRHVLKGYAHLWMPAAPFILIGLVVCLRRFRQSPYRMILTAVLAAPSGAALAGIGITRALFMVFPASLLATLGLLVSYEALRALKWSRKIPRPVFSIWLPGLACVGLLSANVAMLQDCLKNGGTWYTDYGLYGMQYGAKQVFEEIRIEHETNPQTKIVLSPAWANGTDILARFFFADPIPFTLAGIDSYINDILPLDSSTLLILLPNELEDLNNSQKFTHVQVEKILPYPNGEPGFYFLFTQYIENIEEVFAQEKQARRELVGGDYLLQDGSLAGLHASPLDMGSLQDVLDGDPLTIARSWEANPFRFVFDFQEPRTIQQIRLRVGGEPTRVEVELWQNMDTAATLFTLELKETPNPREAVLSVNLPQTVIKAEVRVYNENQSEPAHVHVWEIRFLPDQ
jgi:4-amino-4-deoxy-L-arabinose transferase-like glycosyltransferase